MSKEETEDILEELHLVRPEILAPKAKKLFEAIMCIADGRDKLIQENQELKKQLEEKTKIGISDHKYASKCEDKVITMENQQKEFIKYLEDEKNRLARECSNIYEDILGHTRLVNGDKFDEANDILQKYKSIIGDDKYE